ncbi:putative colanic acid biosynthesis acetyltransferase [Cerasicoccus maritimus]|uniref:putative colanic acid biosynthesis acetyltransferase n=1 Tax=Cerasicoccus maritimus TaxID=490089 RepID=UPI002852C5DE|nr:putative colanic acid biosynthesis acetyltransferase [Cerasicoccus maritimus]
MNANESRHFYPESYHSELGFKNKLGRAMWGVVWGILFRPSPRTFFGWRRLLLRLFGGKIAESAVVYPSARIYAPWKLEMLERSCLGDFVDCYCVDQVTVGVDCTVSQYSYLCTASHDIESPSRDLTTAPIRLERGSWVFAGSFVGPGVTVGEGAIVGARSLVVKSVAPYDVVGGNPAKFIKKRKAEWVEHGE